MSVPGLMGSQYFDLPAGTEKRGSTVISVAFLLSASVKVWTCPLCRFSPMCDPSSTMQRALAMSVRSGELADSPTVSRKPTSRGPRHWANAGSARLSDPQALSRCRKCRLPDPWLSMTSFSGPCVAAIERIFPAMKSSASSQDASTKVCRPSTVLRISGVFSRSGSRYAPGPPVPRVHRRPPLCRSSALPVIFQSWSSSL